MGTIRDKSTFVSESIIELILITHPAYKAVKGMPEGRNQSHATEPRAGEWEAGEDREAKSRHRGEKDSFVLSRSFKRYAMTGSRCWA